MAKREVRLDINHIFPTDIPRLSPSISLGEATCIGEINLEGIKMIDTGDGNLYVQQGNHRIGRLLEIAPEQRVEVEVFRARKPTGWEIKYGEYINRMEFFRVMKCNW